MDIKLNIKREKSFVGVVMPMRVFFENRLVCSLNNGESAEVMLPYQRGVLRVEMAGNKANLQPIRAQALIDPTRCRRNEIVCNLNITTGILNVLFGGLFLPAGKLNISIQYF